MCPACFGSVAWLHLETEDSPATSVRPVFASLKSGVTKEHAK